MVLHVQASKRDPFPRFSWNQEGYIDFYNDVEVDKYLSNSDKKTIKKQGSVISKYFLVSSISSKKTEENKSTWDVIAVKSNLFIRFLEEFLPWKFAFEFYWPLVGNCNSFYRTKSYRKMISLDQQSASLLPKAYNFFLL